jgi:hypothetical protein
MGIEIDYFKKFLNYVLSKTKNVIKNVTKSPTSRVFFILHLIVLIVALVQKGDIYFQGQIEYYPELYQFLFFINIPSMIVATIISLPLALIYAVVALPFTTHPTGGFDLDYYEPSSWILCFYAAWQIQWALIGYWAEKLFKSWRK